MTISNKQFVPKFVQKQRKVYMYSYSDREDHCTVILVLKDQPFCQKNGCFKMKAPLKWMDNYIENLSP